MANRPSGMVFEPMVGHVFPDQAVQVIVLNGGSSSGKSTLVETLQELLPDLWLTFDVDAFIDSLPGHGDSPRADITFQPNGDVETGSKFRAREDAWRTGLSGPRHRGHASGPGISGPPWLNAPWAITLEQGETVLGLVRIDVTTAATR